MKPSRDILVIDDEQVVLGGVERICGIEGLSVDTASSGRIGLEVIEKHTYRLILCDIMMEDVDGFQFLAESVRRGHTTPVVMTTGYSTIENAVRSLQCGAIDYLPKPFTADELMAVVRRGLVYGAMRDRDANGLVDARPCPPQFYRLGNVSWAAKETEGTLRIGVNDLFVKTMRGIRSIDLSPAGHDLIQGTGCATIVSADGFTHDVMCPVSGHIIDVNAEAAAHPAVVESDPYGAGWLYRILPTNLEYSLRCLASGVEAPGPLDDQREGDSP